LGSSVSSQKLKVTQGSEQFHHKAALQTTASESYEHSEKLNENSFSFQKAHAVQSHDQIVRISENENFLIT
jgi:hypothetical protein